MDVATQGLVEVPAVVRDMHAIECVEKGVELVARQADVNRTRTLD